MNIETRKIGDIVVLDIKGKMTIGKGDVQLREHFKAILETGEKKFLFNMADVPWIDSAGTGEVVACHKRARERGAIIKIVMKAGRAHEVFVLAWLDRVFEMFEAENEALVSFN